ncbi:MAG: hypothetical protein HY077_08665 [Elusimicrobia bacterium]|nr:hypothetical protein [Elusimicrobiota bacterium]
MKKLAVLAVLAVPAAAYAQIGEEAALNARQGFSILSSVRFPVFQKVAAPLAAPKAAADAKLAAADLETLFIGGTKPAEKDLRGWFSGRRFTQTGPTAALFTGSDVYNDPKQGPIAGKTFKILLWGADKVIEGQPETYWDEPGSAALDAIAWNLQEQGPSWSRADFTLERSVVSRKGQAAYEVKKAGDWLVVKYPNGDYGYYFKKVR